MGVPEKLLQLQSKIVCSPLPLWNTAHLSRRSGVMVVLSPSRLHDLEVLLTIRSMNLSYGGDAAFPGGKADLDSESPWDTALREMHEEVGVEAASVERVALMPGYVSSRLLMVVPCVAWSPRAPVTATAGDAEVHKVFRMPLSRFLEADGHRYVQGELSSGAKIKLSHFDIRATNKKVGEPAFDKVWGLTANILIDLARLVYEREPEFVFHRGQHGVASDLHRLGNMGILESLASRGILQSPYQRRPRASSSK